MYAARLTIEGGGHCPYHGGPAGGAISDRMEEVYLFVQVALGLYCKMEEVDGKTAASMESLYNYVSTSGAFSNLMVISTSLALGLIIGIFVVQVGLQVSQCCTRCRTVKRTEGEHGRNGREAVERTQSADVEGDRGLRPRQWYPQIHTLLTHAYTRRYAHAHAHAHTFVYIQRKRAREIERER